MARLKEAIENKKVTFFPMGIGNANYKLLCEYNNGGMVLKADAANFKEAFVWLSSSMAVLSKTSRGDGDSKFTMPPMPSGLTIEVD